MENIYEKPVLLLPGSCDFAGRLGVANTFTLFMDIAAEHAERLGIGMLAMAQRKLFWLTVRTRVRFYQRPKMNQTVTLATWPGVPGKLRCERYYELRDGETVLCEGRTEWAILQTDTAKLYPTQDIYPEGLQPLEKTVCDGPFAVINGDFGPATTRAACRVGSMDIDVGGHMNNAAYLRMLLDTFSTAELAAMHIKEAEICFRSPSFEGETLSIHSLQTEQGLDLAMHHSDGKPAALVRLICA